MSKRDEEDQAGQDELDDFDKATGDDDPIEVTGVPEETDDFDDVDLDDDDEDEDEFSPTGHDIDDDALIDLDDEYDDHDERVGDIRRGDIVE